MGNQDFAQIARVETTWRLGQCCFRHDRDLKRVNYWEMCKKYKEGKEDNWKTLAGSSTENNKLYQSHLKHTKLGKNFSEELWKSIFYKKLSISL